MQHNVTIYINEDGVIQAINSNGATVHTELVTPIEYWKKPDCYSDTVSRLRALRREYLRRAYDPFGDVLLSYPDRLEYHDQAKTLLKSLVLEFVAQFGMSNPKVRLEHPWVSYIHPNAATLGSLCVHNNKGGSPWANKLCVTTAGSVRSCVATTDWTFNSTTAETIAQFWAQLDTDVLGSKYKHR